MTTTAYPKRTASYKAGLAAYAALAGAWVFVLVTLGAFTTSIGAGMAFPDWPLSNGSLNPNGWLDDLAMFAEHSHRLSAGLMTTLTLVLAVWVWRTEARDWVRRLAVGALLLVVFQAVLGGLRVLLDHIALASLETSVGRLFAMLHACVAQVFACTLIAIAVSLSRTWIEKPRPVSRAVQVMGRLTCALLLLQLAVAAVMRHSFAGLAIPTFPYSTADGALLPDAWNFRVGIHFTHRVLALLLTFCVLGFAGTLWRDRGASLALKVGASFMVSLLGLQILLGAAIIATHRAATMTTGHVLVGACTLATTFWLTWTSHRDQVEASCR